MSSHDQQPFEDQVLSGLMKEAAVEQPPAELDARVLQQARLAVSAKAPRARGPFSVSWMLPASLAAVLVLSVSVVLLTEEQVEMRPSLRSIPRQETPPAVDLPAMDAAETSPRDTPQAAFSDTTGLKKEFEHPVAGRPAPAAEAMLENVPDPVLQPSLPAAGIRRTQRQPASREEVRGEGEYGVMEKARRSEDKRQIDQDLMMAPAGSMAGPAEVLRDDEDHGRAELAEIARLWRRGNQDRARQALRQFRLRHPEFDLQEFLAGLPGLAD